MKNEQTKKTYLVPEMEIVELNHQASLLDCSNGGECDEPDIYNGGGAG